MWLKGLPLTSMPNVSNNTLNGKRKRKMRKDGCRSLDVWLKIGAFVVGAIASLVFGVSREEIPLSIYMMIVIFFLYVISLRG